MNLVGGGTPCLPLADQRLTTFDVSPNSIAQVPKLASNQFETTSWRFTQTGYIIDLARLHGSGLV